MTENKPRRQRRTKASIVASIESAASDEIAQNGFSASLVTNIIKKANIEPQVFYNRYKDIQEFYDAYVRRYDYTLNELIDTIGRPLTTREGLAALLKKMMNAVNDDPLMLELIRWEVNSRNKTTLRSSMLRELNLQPIMHSLTRAFRDSGVDITAIFSMMVGGVYYLLMRKKMSPVFGVDLNTEEGQRRVDETIDYLVDLIYRDISHADRLDRIARRLRQAGITEDVIDQALSDD